MTTVIIPKTDHKIDGLQFTIITVLQLFTITVYIYSFTVYIQVRSREPREDSVDTQTSNSHTGFHQWEDGGGNPSSFLRSVLARSHPSHLWQTDQRPKKENNHVVKPNFFMKQQKNSNTQLLNMQNNKFQTTQNNYFLTITTPLFHFPNWQTFSPAFHKKGLIINSFEPKFSLRNPRNPLWSSNSPLRRTECCSCTPGSLRP